MRQLSPDGRWMWDGWRWVPLQRAAPPRPLQPRRPTLWTRRIQALVLLVAGWGLVASILSALLFPTEWNHLRDQLVAQLQGAGTPGSEIAGLEQTAHTIAWIALIFSALWSMGFFALQLVGTLRRWAWWYWVQFAFCCWSVVTTPFLVLNPALTPNTLLALIGNLLDLVLGVCMLVVGARLGPWAMTREPVPASRST